MSSALSPSLDVVAVGNAIVDVLAHADDAFLEAHGMAKGVMTLIDAVITSYSIHYTKLYEAMYKDQPEAQQPGAESAAPQDESVVDADFEEVDNSKK